MCARSARTHNIHRLPYLSAVQSLLIIEGNRGLFDGLDAEGSHSTAELAKLLGAPVVLVIDEGQDMPPRFYQALAEMGFEHFFVVADQNQQITDQHSKVNDIADALDLDPDARIELRENYRNSYPVARLARAFCVGDPASPCTRLPAPGVSALTPFPVE